jgi:hypothetical protein
MATTTMEQLQELMGLLAQHIDSAQREGDEREENVIGSAILNFAEMDDIGHVLQWLRECALGKALDAAGLYNGPDNVKREAVTVLRFKRKPS